MEMSTTAPNAPFLLMSQTLAPGDELTATALEDILFSTARYADLLSASRFAIGVAGMIFAGPHEMFEMDLTAIVEHAKAQVLATTGVSAADAPPLVQHLVRGEDVGVLFLQIDDAFFSNKMCGRCAQCVVEGGECPGRRNYFFPGIPGECLVEARRILQSAVGLFITLVLLSHMIKAGNRLGVRNHCFPYMVARAKQWCTVLEPQWAEASTTPRAYSIPHPRGVFGVAGIDIARVVRFYDASDHDPRFRGVGGFVHLTSPGVPGLYVRCRKAVIMTGAAPHDVDARIHLAATRAQYIVHCLSCALMGHYFATATTSLALSRVWQERIVGEVIWQSPKIYIGEDKAIPRVIIDKTLSPSFEPFVQEGVPPSVTIHAHFQAHKPATPQPPC